MRWWQRSAFHKMTYAERYPYTWDRLQHLHIGVDGSTGMHDTVVALLDYVDALHQRIDQLEIERDLT